MRSIVMFIFYHTKFWGRSLRVLTAFLLGIVVCIMQASKYLAFAEAIGSPVLVFESFIIVGSTVPFFMSILLGNLLLLSDVPFASTISKYEILRIGRNKWIRAQILYIFLACTLYSLAILLFTVVISVIASDAVFFGDWSPAMVMLAEKQPEFAIISFKLSFAFPNLINSISADIALLLTLVFNTLYMVLISLIILVVNLLSKHSIGWLAASVVHIFGYIGYANGGFGIPLKYSLLCCAAPAYHYINELQMSSLYSFTIFIVLIAILAYACKQCNSKIETHI